jgi:hypothetical protein
VIAVEYGEAQTVRLAPSAGRGTLVVTSNAPRATVTIDGREVGTTPWTGVIEAGPHSVIVAAPGFTTVERAVEVPADGTAQIQGALGRPVGYVEPTRREARSSHLVIESGSYLPRGYVGAIGAGYRGASQRFEATTSLTFSSGGGVGWGLRLRGFAATGVVRPYAVAGLNYGSPSSAFVGGGLLLATGDGPVRLEYFVESGYAAAATPRASPSFRSWPGSTCAWRASASAAGSGSGIGLGVSGLGSRVSASGSGSGSGSGFGFGFGFGFRVRVRV